MGIFHEGAEAAERPIIGGKKVSRAMGQQGLGLGWGAPTMQLCTPVLLLRVPGGMIQREA